MIDDGHSYKFVYIVHGVRPHPTCGRHLQRRAYNRALVHRHCQAQNPAAAKKTIDLIIKLADFALDKPISQGWIKYPMVNTGGVLELRTEGVRSYGKVIGRDEAGRTLIVFDRAEDKAFEDTTDPGLTDRAKTTTEPIAARWKQLQGTAGPTTVPSNVTNLSDHRAKRSKNDKRGDLMQRKSQFVSMTEAERASLAMVMQGLDLGPIAAEEILAEGHVTDFLKALYDHMEAEGVSAAELARRMHVQPNQIHRWLSTESSPKASTMFLLARMLGYKIEQTWQRIDSAYAPAGQFTAGLADAETFAEDLFQVAA